MRAWLQLKRSTRFVCVVYGNCHADPIRRLLDDSQAFHRTFQTVAIPAAHEITGDQLESVKSTLAGAKLLVTQPVRDDYRGLPIGSEQLAGALPENARRITIPALYYDGTYPFQVYVRPTDTGRAPVPIVSAYHDLRFLHCAAQGWNVDRAKVWLNTHRPSPEGIRAVAKQAQARLAEYEAPLDVHVHDRLTSPELHGRGFFTVDYPTNAGMMELVAGNHGAWSSHTSRGTQAGRCSAPTERRSRPPSSRRSIYPTRPGRTGSRAARPTRSSRCWARTWTSTPRTRTSSPPGPTDHAERMLTLGIKT